MVVMRMWTFMTCSKFVLKHRSKHLNIYLMYTTQALQFTNESEQAKFYKISLEPVGCSLGLLGFLNLQVCKTMLGVLGNISLP